MAACPLRLLSLRNLLICACFSTGIFHAGYAQTVLFSEDFNSCAFPSSWETNLEGFGGAVWYAGMPQNPKCDGTSIDGTCMLIFDDDAAGNNTPPWRLQVATPSFDASGWTSVSLSVDVHFRNYGNAFLKIYAWNGSEYEQLAKYQGSSGHTGIQFSEYRTFTADLSFYAGPDTRLMFEFDDGNVWGWWAGIDNIEVTGEGTAQNVLLETFNDCVLPAGWSNEIISGQNDWQFGELTNGNAWASTTMNGTCFAYFDDDGITQAAPPSRVRLISPEIDGSQFSNFYLDFDVIFRRYVAQESFSVGVLNVETGEISWAVDYYTDLGGPQLNSYVHEHIDLSAHRSQKMQLVFQYDDGATWNWWVGLDNIKLSGEGIINDLCANALDIGLNEPCVEANNLTALFDGETPGCVERSLGSLWYRYMAQQDGIVEIRPNADFNDVINVFSGDCGALGELVCTNRDEFGFTGERLFFQAQAGQTYLLRISGRPDAFAPARGNLCLQLVSAEAIPEVPHNESCELAIPLTLNDECVDGNNFNAAMNGPQPSRNALARADIWYSFVATPSSPLPTLSGNFEILTHADFADVITVYKGVCGNLEEIACNEKGERLIVEGLSWGSTYYVQVSGAFATIEGHCCVEVKEVPPVTPPNEICSQALPVTIDGPCVSASNVGATFDGPVPSCDVFNSAAVWFSFVAPSTGSVQLNTDATFQHVVTIFGGECNNLEEVYCERNPIACQGFVQVNNLLPNATYWLRISSTANISGFAEQGEMCLRILNSSTPAPFEPLGLDVQVICLNDGTGRLNIHTEGGQGAYTFSGQTEQDVLNEGDSYLVVVSDEHGCEKAVTGQVNCAVNNCSLELLTAVTHVSCNAAADGQAQVSVVQGEETYAYEWSTGETGTAISGLAAGYYEVTVTDPVGCAAIGTITIEQPLALAFVVDEIVESNGDDGAIFFTASGGTAPYTVLWSYNGGLFEPIDDLQALAPGSYIAQVTDANGCTLQSEEIVVQQIVAVNEAGEPTLLSLLPNPTTGRAMLYLELPESTDLNIAIYDAAGQLLRQFPHKKTNSLALPIDLTLVPAGIYMIKIQSGSQIWSRRLVVSR